MTLSTKDLERVSALTKKAKNIKTMIAQIGAVSEHLLNQGDDGPELGIQVSPADEPPGLLGMLFKAMENHQGAPDCDCPSCVQKNASKGKPTDRARFTVDNTTAVKMLGVAHASKQLELAGVLAELSSMGIDFENETNED